MLGESLNRLGRCAVAMCALAGMPPVGSIFTIGGQSGSDIFPDSASDGVQHLVVWTNSTNKVLGQFTTATGPTGPLITIWTGTEVSRARVCWSGFSQKYIVVWDGRTGPTWNVYRATVAPGGTTASSAATLNTQNGKDARDPDVGACGSGVNGVVVAYAEDFSGQNWDIRGVACDASGNAFSAPFVIEATSDKETLPAVSQQTLNSDPQQATLGVAWTKQPIPGGVPGSGDIRFMNLTNQSGVITLGSTVTVSTSTLDEFAPDVAGSYPDMVVTWTKNNFGGFDIDGRRLSGTTPQGTGPTNVLSTSSTATQQTDYGRSRVTLGRLGPTYTSSPTTCFLVAAARTTKVIATGALVNTQIRLRQITGSTGLNLGTSYTIGGSNSFYGSPAVSSDSNMGCPGFLVSFDDATSSSIQAQLHTPLGCQPSPPSVARVSVKRVLAAGPGSSAWPSSQSTVQGWVQGASSILAPAGVTLVLDQYIDIIDPAAWFSAAINGVTRTGMETAAEAHPCTYEWRFDAINVYLTNGGGVTGYCSFPFDGTMSNDLILMGPGSQPEVARWLAHEIGHYIGLFHTHESFSGAEAIGTCAAGSVNCDSLGDMVCDTSWDPNNEPMLQTNYSPGSCEYVRLRWNVMSYYAGLDPTSALLTAGQIARAATYLPYRNNVMVGGTYLIHGCSTPQGAPWTLTVHAPSAPNSTYGTVPSGAPPLPIGSGYPWGSSEILLPLTDPVLQFALSPAAAGILSDVTGMTGGSGAATTTVTLPPTPSLAGLVIYWQSGVLSPSGPIASQVVPITL